MYYQGIKKIIVTCVVDKKPSRLNGLHPIIERIFLARGIATNTDRRGNDKNHRRGVLHTPF